MSTIKSILTSIGENNKENVANLIRKLPLLTLSKDVVDELLSKFLLECEKFKSKELVKLVIDEFEAVRSRVDEYPILISLLSNSNMKKNSVLFCFGCFPEMEHWEYCLILLNIRDHELSLSFANKLDCYFDDITLEQWQMLYKCSCKTEENDDDEEINELLNKFFEIKIKENQSDIEMPEWVKEMKKGTIVEVPKYIPPVNQAVKLLIDDIKKLKVTNNKNKPINVEEDASVQEMLISEYGISTVVEKIQMLEPVLKLEKFNDIPLFNEFGPVNTIYTEHPEHLEEDHDCVKYGGCRMLLCNDHEEMDDEGDAIDMLALEEYHNNNDWFRGKCDICLRKISKRCYAVRQPLYYGGWKGCYCSFKCMEPDTEEGDTYVSLMIGRMKEQLNVIGIRNQ
jgi:hypothetical protein